MFGHLPQLLRNSSVASLAPTTKRCVKRILESVDFSVADTIIEFGPGDGAFTGALLKRMKPGAKLIAIEMNDEFVEILRKNFKDSRLTVIHDSAENLLSIRQRLELPKVDYILTGIPFSFLQFGVKQKLVNDCATVLNRTGKCIVYQSLTAPKARYSLEKAFEQKFKITKDSLLFLNIPPLYVLEAELR